MKPLIRCLWQVADSSLESSLCCNQIRRRDVHQPTAAVFCVKRATVASSVPSGHVPVNVGDKMERVFVFERVVEILQSGVLEFSDLPELVASLSGDDLSLWLPGVTE
ncbi:hypothetical protein AALP_AA2G239100 [Arabis alpina]|uniref:Uncharacterized protein n=1 Tax=Arabis alpina TaxID=50452 RepID=A0A087HJK7_ARAAL|nr:hypothetical protein AALP_AA2G239100 [Arabis alpina]